jgi:hypothetical protein
MTLNIDPPPHDGINIWCIASARKCQFAGLSAGEAEQRILAFQGQTRRPLKTSEVRRAVEKAYQTILPPDPNFQKKEKEKWQPRQTASAFRPSRKGITAADIWDISPCRIDGGINQRMVLEWLYPDPEGLICVGKSAFDFRTGHLARFKDASLNACQFVVPGYMSKVKGLTQEGTESMHCLDNCGPRRFCVCDFDEPKSAEHPSIIWYLKDLFDLVMVISSGGKSLHAWFNVPASLEPEFWKVAIQMGADAALMRNRSSFVRMPFGTRDNGHAQQLFYFNPEKLPYDYGR